MICKKCVMDTTDKEIFFDEAGICNHCHRFEENKKYLKTPEELNPIIPKIKEENKNKKYDCVIGLSGGVDSSYVAYQASKYGLRAVLVHVDNGSSSPEAINNVRKIAEYTKYPLESTELDPVEYRELIKAYIKASVLDLEVPTDHAIVAITNKTALKYGVKYILSGSNYASEGVFPSSWAYLKQDARNIKDIYAKFGKFGNGTLTNFPFFSFFDKKWHEKVLKDLKTIQFLDYLNYDKKEAKKILVKKVGWKDYGEKHCESVWTRFFQDYILVQKFGIDTRKAYYSSLINAGQMERKDALDKLKVAAYTKNKLKADRVHILEWLQMTNEELEVFMGAPKREHTEFRNIKKVADFYTWAKRKGG